MFPMQSALTPTQTGFDMTTMMDMMMMVMVMVMMMKMMGKVTENV